jgi:DNA-directed RNA polymerase specialized sigma24 family protein
MICRSIPEPEWERARELLIFYFSRRHGFSDAADLAHETLAALWESDFEFKSVADFPLVCHAFARLISLSAFRKSSRFVAEHREADSIAARDQSAFGLTPTEMRICLGQIAEAAQSRLSGREWDVIEKSTELERSAVGAELGLGDANNVRVFLHRARRKLKKITGWK